MENIEAIKKLIPHLKHVNIIRLELMAMADNFPKLTVDEVWNYIVKHGLEDQLYFTGYRPQNTPIGDECLFKENDKYYEFFSEDRVSGWREYHDLETPARRKLFNILYFFNRAIADTNTEKKDQS